MQRRGPSPWGETRPSAVLADGSPHLEQFAHVLRPACGGSDFTHPSFVLSAAHPTAECGLTVKRYDLNMARAGGEARVGLNGFCDVVGFLSLSEIRPLFHRCSCAVGACALILANAVVVSVLHIPIHVRFFFLERIPSVEPHSYSRPRKRSMKTWASPPCGPVESPSVRRMEGP